RVPRRRAHRARPHGFSRHHAGPAGPAIQPVGTRLALPHRPRAGRGRRGIRIRDRAVGRRHPDHAVPVRRRRGPAMLLSPLDTILSRLSRLDANSAHIGLDALLDTFSVSELATAFYHWPLFARAPQIIPDGPFRVWGLLCARGWGKTRAAISFALQEIEAGR